MPRGANRILNRSQQRKFQNIQQNQGRKAARQFKKKVATNRGMAMPDKPRPLNNAPAPQRPAPMPQQPQQGLPPYPGADSYVPPENPYQLPDGSMPPMGDSGMWQDTVPYGNGGFSNDLPYGAPPAQGGVAQAIENYNPSGGLPSQMGASAQPTYASQQPVMSQMIGAQPQGMDYNMFMNNRPYWMY